MKSTLSYKLERWVTDDVSGKLDYLHPVLARVLNNRNITSEQEVDYNLQNLADSDLLTGIDRATEILLKALQQQAHIMIVGDFDADGATSTALAIRGLRAMGAGQLSYLVPNRFEFGYGLTPEIVAVAKQEKPDLIITVDNGISSIEGVDAARQSGIDVIVTDHHLPGEKLPDAVAIVNPNQQGDKFPSKNLAGVGVMFYVLIALRKRLREAHWFEEQKIDEPNLAVWLDLVAVGTVADVVPLDFNNRILVEQGLRRIRAGKCIPGILALLKIAGRDYSRIVATDLGFTVGPRLNAAGRLEDMSVGIECLLTDNQVQAEQLATELDSLNRQRREIEADMRAQAFSHIDETFEHAEKDKIGVCLFHPDWHQGVVGLVAARVKERLHRPVIAFAQAEDGILKGSARSIPGCHIRDVLVLVDSQHPDLIEKFGGHAMAAGLSLPAKNLEKFSQAYDEAVTKLVDPKALQPLVSSDGELKDNEFSLDTARLLRTASPWGQGFPEPIFDGVFKIVQRRVLQEKHLKLVLVTDENEHNFDVHGCTNIASAGRAGAMLDAIIFNVDVKSWPDEGEKIHIAYRLDVNYFRGEENLQLMIVQKFELEMKQPDTWSQ
ncbi:MAG TPA: single-stranded-DNA-specific exonuclease RecJ [Chromatiales bacterium]|nr:single-stranded-DNA-specific exonuclease RecJ [Thiotrichales bacterium]HIP68999.1 single-stranded-DNA-specific exonuclease RecJ [Chromatiales bacterium]